jgi:MFS family permease
MIGKTVTQYYVLTACSTLSLGFALSTYVTFLITRGLNLLEVNMVNFIFYTTLFMMEIPTGAFADVFGRKKSVALSGLLLGIGELIYAWSDTFFDFALAEIVSAFGITFATGAFQAWVVDTLKHHGYNGSFGKIFSNASKIKTACFICAALIGGYAADYNDRLPWIMGGIGNILTCIIVLVWIKEEYFIPMKFSFTLGWQAMKDTVKTSFKYARESKVVRFILVVGVLQICSVQAINMQWQPYFHEYLGSKRALGYLWMAMMIGVFVGQHYALKLFSLLKSEKKCLVACQIGAGLGMIVTVLLPFPGALAVFLLHEIPRGMYHPIKDMFLQDNILSKERATVSSFESISPHLGGMIGLLGSGILANKLGIPATWITSGLILIIGTLLVSRNGRAK